ncbi:MAG: acyl carrier protein [Proteocatella sp.]|jgi:acyl carrier protein|nr:acyl carrier protein [Proteocatella sp.]MBP8654077.1 acyl carrier protein [Proteocatella sp.]MBP9658615.1 acyl carrier protein [Proteocatella sp.]MBP9966739.1 acyl carrier protein [Proteocatella sp.]NCB70441.1 acyl carrier protein [Clostridia bacterium]
MIFETIRKIISEQLGLDEKIISLDSNLTTDLDADSLDAVEIIMAIEDEFSIEIPDDRIEDLVTIHDLVEYIESSVQA